MSEAAKREMKKRMAKSIQQKAKMSEAAKREMKKKLAKSMGQAIVQKQPKPDVAALIK